jgi:hypothetical protein
MPTAQDPIEVITSNYIPVPWSGCWLWLGPVDKEGYGVLHAGGLHMKAHRFSLMLHKRFSKVKLHALHTCDVPGCINPEHLYWGTDADNTTDRQVRGRTRHAPPRMGTDHHGAKITNEDALIIRESLEPTRTLAKRHGVCHQTIRNIQLKRNWKHLP